MTPQINRATRVKFDKDGATHFGTVFHTTIDIQNSRKMAVIEVEGELPGVIYTIPMDQVTLTHNIVFLSGSMDGLGSEVADRRFFPINAIA